MDLSRFLLVAMLVLGVLHSGLAKPSTAVSDDDYPLMSDDNYDYDKDDNESTGVSSERNDSRSAESNNVQPYFNRPEYTAIVRVGNTARLECNALNLASSSVRLWYNGTKLIATDANVNVNDQRISIDDQRTLTIADVTLADHGEYTCQVVPAPLGSEVKLRVRLDVQTRPQVHIYAADGREIGEQTVTLRQNERYVLECRGSGRPQPQLKWSADGQRLMSGRGLQVDDDGRLTILAAGHDQVRKFQCLADNGISVAHTGVSVDVMYSPLVRARHAIVNTALAHTADLHCDYNTSSDASVLWRKNGQSIEPGSSSKYTVRKEHRRTDGHHRSTLEVHAVQTDDLGVYECLVQNGLGKGEASVRLIVQPEPPTFESADVRDDLALTHWTIRSQQALSEVELKYMRKDSVTWRSDVAIHQKSKEHSGIWKVQHKLTLKPGTWHVRVKAKNADGWSEYSEQATIVIEPHFGTFESQEQRDDDVNQRSGADRSNAGSSIVALVTAIAIGANFRRAH